jgi:F-type H+-transporting ATPase subunit a
MTRVLRTLTALGAAFALVAAPLAAQEHGDSAATSAVAGVPAAQRPNEPVDIITPHITDSHELELPGPPPTFVTHVHLPQWAPVNIGGVMVDLSPTKHVVFMLIAALTAMLVLIGTARAHAKHTHKAGVPKGFAAGMEGMVLYLRNEVILPNVGHHGNGFVPFLLSLFFFILFCNLWGIVPWGATATGNISVTLTLAAITLVVIEGAGMRANGLGYLSTIFYWNKELPIVMRVLMFIILTPIEIAGKIAKPFALMIRLFANMTAGHIVVLALIGMIFTFKSLASGAPLLMAVAINMLEIFVAFLQAFIFTLLSSVFIGQIREAHH